jgi:hypothetical protein
MHALSIAIAPLSRQRFTVESVREPHHPGGKGDSRGGSPPSYGQTTRSDGQLRGSPVPQTATSGAGDGDTILPQQTISVRVG